MLSTSPVLTVILPVFNESVENLSSCFDSLVSQKLSFKCLIIDESSSPETSNFIDQFTQKHPNFEHLRPNKRLGLVGSLNLGLELCTTKYIARFDSDDICSDERFEKQIAFLENNKNVGVVGAQVYLINKRSEKIGERRYPIHHAEIVRKMSVLSPFAHPVVMFNVDALPDKSLLKYDINLRYSEDLDLWIRLADAGVKFANLDDYLLAYRISDQERSRAHWRSNLAVRARNFISKPKLNKLLGLLAIGLISILPLKTISFMKEIFLHRHE